MAMKMNTSEGRSEIKKENKNNNKIK